MTWRVRWIALALAALVAGCSQMVGASAQKRLTVLSIESPSASGMKAMAPGFTAATGWDVEFHVVSYDDAVAAALMSHRSNLGDFDVIQFDNGFIPTLADAGVVSTIDDQIATSRSYDPEDVPPEVRALAEYNGSTWGLGLSTEPMVLWYRPHALAAAGVEPPSTPEEFLTASRTLDSVKTAGSALGYGATGGGFFLWQFLLASGLDPIAPDRCSAQLDTPAVIEAVEGFVRNAQFTPTRSRFGSMDEANEDFLAGNAAMQINVTGYFNLYPAQGDDASDEFVMAVTPMEDDGLTLVLAYMLGVAAKSQNPEVAWDFIEYVLGADGVARLIEANAPPPVRRSLANSPLVTERVPYYDLLLDGRGTTFPYVANVDLVLAELSRVVHLLANEPTSDVVEELELADRRADKLLAASARRCRVGS